MAIKYTFRKDISQSDQESFMKWHVINVEQDVYPKSVRKVSKNVYLVTYKSDGTTSKELERHLWNKGYFKIKKEGILLKTQFV